MESKNLIVFGCWISVTVIAVVYMIVFGETIGDIMFGVLLPIGFLLIFALLATVLIINTDEKTNK